MVQSSRDGSISAPGVNRNTDWLWIMHPPLVKALKELGWFNGPA